MLHPCKQSHLHPTASNVRPPKKIANKTIPISAQQQLESVYQQYLKADHPKKQTRLLWKLIKLCHKEGECQHSLARLLNLPHANGPISLNSLPSTILGNSNKVRRGEDQISQLQFLLQYLKTVKEHYFCWVIYFNEELGVLNVKLCREDQLQDNSPLFNPNLNLIGMFLNRVEKYVEQREQVQEFYCGFGKSESVECSKGTTSHSTGLTWQSLNTGANKDKTKSKFRKNKIRMRSISPKLKIISTAQYIKPPFVAPEPTKNSKARSFLSRQAKSKSSSQLLRQQLSKDINKQFNKKSQICQIEPRGVEWRGRFKKKSKAQLYESVYGRQ